jgi:hypothetical protein
MPLLLLVAAMLLLQLGNLRPGSMAVQWRNVPCWYKPSSPASVPNWMSPTAQPSWEKAPDGWSRDQDRRHNNDYKWGTKQNAQSGRKL